MRIRRKTHLVLISALLALTLLLPSCQFFSGMLLETPFYLMEYERPSYDDLRATTDEVLELLSSPSPSEKKVTEKLSEFFIAFSDYFTMDSLANLFFSVNTQSEKYREECEYLSRNSIYVQKCREEILVACAKSPLKEKLEKNLFSDSLDDYVDYAHYTDPEYFEMALQEAQLVENYRTASSDAQMELVELLSGGVDEGKYKSILLTFMQDSAKTLGAIYHDLTVLRKAMVKELGYENYLALAGEGLGREFAVSDMQDYLKKLRPHVSLKGKSEDANYAALSRVSDEYELYAILENTCIQMDTASSNLDGYGFYEHYDYMRRNDLCDLSFSPRKENASFTTYLYSYYSPYININPEGNLADATTLFHEFGHFVDMHQTMNASSSIDLAEVFSTGFEQLAVRYLDSESSGLSAREISALQTYEDEMVWQTICSQGVLCDFEMAIYDDGSDIDTSDYEALSALYASLRKKWGYDDGESTFLLYSWVFVPHIFQYPSYVFSYIIATDIAIQLATLEAQDPGRGLFVYRNLLNRDTDADFVTVVKDAGLDSPFEHDCKALLNDFLTSRKLPSPPRAQAA